MIEWLNAIFYCVANISDSALFAVCEDNLQRPTNKCGMIHITYNVQLKSWRVILNEKFCRINTQSIFVASLIYNLVIKLLSEVQAVL